MINIFGFIFVTGNKHIIYAQDGLCHQHPNLLRFFQ